MKECPVCLHFLREDGTCNYCDSMRKTKMIAAIQSALDKKENSSFYLIRTTELEKHLLFLLQLHGQLKGKMSTRAIRTLVLNTARKVLEPYLQKEVK